MALVTVNPLDMTLSSPVVAEVNPDFASSPPLPITSPLVAPSPSPTVEFVVGFTVTQL